MMNDFPVHSMFASLLHFAATTPLQKIRHLPTETWINVAICVAGILVILRLWRTLKALNDYGPYLACAVVASGVFFYWVYTRTEPAFLTPVVEKLAPFFPTQKDQQGAVDRARSSRD